jgi:hypothetical protein
VQIPPLKTDTGTYIVSNEAKAEEIAAHLQTVWNDKDGVKPHLPANLAVPAEFLSDVESVFDELQKIRNNCAPGPDGIHPTMLKVTSPYLVASLSKLINRTIHEGHFPECWKKTDTIPIPKINGELSKRDFRPISLSTIVSRVCEAHILQILQQQIEGKLGNEQYGFRPGRGTVDALALHEHRILEGFELCRKKKRYTQVTGVFFDVSKAFDSVPHGALLTCLERDYQVHPVILSWLRSYLEGRSHRVRIEDSFSSAHPILSGVPQGSKLGPVLFIAYINSLSSIPLSENTSIVLYADDLALVKPIVSDNCVAELNQDIAKIHEHFHNLFLSLNPNKTKFMRFSVDPRAEDRPVPNLSIGGVPIERVRFYRYLGVTYDERISWSAHTRIKCNGLKKAVGALNRTFGKQRGEEVMKRVYHQQLFPVLTYALAMWWPQHVQNRVQLEKAQRFALQTIQRNHTRSYEELCQRSNLLPVSWTAAMFRCRLIYLYHTGLHPWEQPFPLSRDAGVRRAPRLALNEDNYELPFCHLERSDTSCYRESVRIWNRVPTDWTSLDKKGFYNRLRENVNLGQLLEPFAQYPSMANL